MQATRVQTPQLLLEPFPVVLLVMVVVVGMPHPEVMAGLEALRVQGLEAQVEALLLERAVQAHPERPIPRAGLEAQERLTAEVAAEVGDFLAPLLLV
jgi:hypothetical protein